MKKVLVVDNHVVTLKYLESLLGKEGFEVRTAEDGIIALDIIKEYKPDIIFVDLVMPYIRGEKLVSILRGFDELKNVKIIVLSGIAAETGSNHVEYGADACIAKGPFNRMGTHILKLVRDFVSGKIDNPVKEVIGTEDVYKRAITTELIASRRHTDVIMDSISDGIIELNRKFRVVYANNAAKEILGIDERKLITSYFEDLCISSNSDTVKEYFKGLQDGSSPDSIIVPRKNSFFELTAKHIITENDESYIIILKDVTLLKKELIEKEGMIKEVYHRVKNNLALISSIVNLQIGDTEDENIQTILFDLKNRMDSIALVHSQVYKSKDPESLLFKDFTDDIFGSMVYSETAEGIDLSYSIDVPEVRIDVDTAISLGLVLTELISNSLKYGFAGSSRGKISLSGKLTGERMSLVFKDDGCGDPEYFSFDVSTLLSLQLVQALTMQMGSDTTFTGSGGAMYEFSIPVKI